MGNNTGGEAHDGDGDPAEEELDASLAPVESSTAGAPRAPVHARRGARDESAPGGNAYVSGTDAAKANAQGVEMLRNGQHQEAVRHFKQALLSEPRSVQILNNIGLAYAKMQDYSAAYEWYDKAYRQNASDVETLFSLAWVERKRKRFSHACDLFQKVLEFQPEHVKALYLLGDILKTRSDYDGAMSQFEKLVRLEPQNIDGNISLAQCYEHIRQYSRAAQLYGHVMKLAPNRQDVAFFLGRVHHAARSYRQALHNFDLVADNDSRAFEARKLSAQACRELADHDRAIAQAERAARLKSHPDVMHFVGEEYLRRDVQGDQQKAAEWFKRALDLDPKHTASLMELGQLMCRQSRWQEAEENLTQLCEIEHSVSAVKALALVKYKLWKYDSCRQCCDAALRLDPLCGDALWLLAELHRHEGKDDQWFLDLRTPSEVSPTDLCLAIAKAYVARRQVTEASSWLTRVQHYQPGDPRVQEALSVLHRQAGTANPKDILEILERRNRPAGALLPTVSRRERADSKLAPSLSPTSPPRSVASGLVEKGPSGTLDVHEALSSEATSEGLERMLRRAERATARPAGGAVGGQSGEQLWQDVLTGARATLRSKPEDPLALRCAARALLSLGGEASEICDLAHRATEHNEEPSGNASLGYQLHAYLASLNEREKDWAKAEKNYTAALSAKPGDQTAMLGLARCLLQRKETARSRQLYEQVSVSAPTCAESSLRLAEIAFEAGEYSEAHRCAVKAAKLAPGEVAAFLILAKACAKTGRSDEAVRAVEQALVLRPTDCEAILLQAQLHRKAGRDQDAITWLKRLLDLQPGNFECNLNLGQLYASKGAGGASQAAHFFRSALQCKPAGYDTRDIHLQLASVQCGISSWKEAQQTLETAVQEFPDDVDLWQKLLTVHSQQKDVKGQQLCHRRLAQLNGMSVSKRVAYGDLLLSEGQQREAREQFEVALLHDPGNVTAILKLAVILRQEGRIDEALKHFDQVLQLSPHNPDALEGAAYCHRKTGNKDQAVNLYLQCLKVTSAPEGALFYLGDILYAQHHHAECQHYLTRLLQMNCSDEHKTGARYLLAKSHVSLDEYEEAEKHARAGLTMKTSQPHFLFILGLVQHRIADHDASISTLKQALAHPELPEGDVLHADIHDWLAQGYERKQEYSLAMAEIGHALKQDPDHVSSLITRGLVYMHSKQLAQAEADFQRALDIEKTHALALVRLGYCKLLASSYMEATLLFQRALQQRCGTVALPKSVKGCGRVYMALCCASQQDVDGALFQLTEARKNHRNFGNLCSNAKESIVKGACESLVQQLRSIPDLDINLAQAWQLVHLLSKELELAYREPAAKGGPAHSGEVATPAVASRLLAPPSQLLSQLPPLTAGPTAGAGGSTASPGVVGSSHAAPSKSPSAPSKSPSKSPIRSREAWTATDSEQQQRRWPAEHAATPSLPSRPVAEQQGHALADGQKHLKLFKHEQIDFSQLEQHECLGTGGFGAVYRGSFHGREVAIKKLFCEDGGNISKLQLEELEKEVAALRSLDHPRLVSFIGACLRPPNLCIVTEFMPAGSLHHLLHKAKTALTLSQQDKMARQVCEGVAFLHSLCPPVVHRDLKSLNIVLDHSYNAKICDFGLTQSMEKTHISVKEGANGGSPRYMAPECWDCQFKITEKVDVWAMGCILIEIFGGPLPYDDCSNIQQILAKVVIDKQAPAIPHHLSPSLRGIIQDCFHFECKLRASAQDVYSRLVQLRLAYAGV